MKRNPCLEGDLTKYSEGSLCEIRHWLDRAINGVESLSELRGTIPSIFGSDRRLASVSNVFLDSVESLSSLTLKEMKDLHSKISEEIKKKHEERAPSLIPV